MSLKEKFEAIKSAIFSSMNYADPAAVLLEAEHKFKEGVIAEFEAIKERLDALEGKGEPVPDEPAPVVETVQYQDGTSATGVASLPAESPVADAAPSPTEPAAPAA